MKIRINDIKNFVFTAIFLIVSSILPVNTAKADIVRQLYEIEVPVSGQSRKERAEVVREALKEILVRISGRNDAAAIANDETLVPRPTGYIQQFRYRKFKGDEIVPAAGEGEKAYTQKLWLRFTEKAVAKLLRQQDMPVWGKTRPATLVWLVVDDKKNRVLIGNSTPHVSRTHISKEAVKRGLPFRLPLLDLADQSRLQVADVWGNFEDTILAASQRYQTEAVLVGRVYQDYSNSWNTRWTLYLSGQRQDWEANSAETLRTAVNEGISKTGEILSERFTQQSASQESETILVKVKNVKNLKAYNLVSKYLNGLSAVTTAEPFQVKPEEVLFRLTSRNGRLGISQAISLGRVLTAEVTPPSTGNETGTTAPEQQKIDLVYKLVP